MADLIDPAVVAYAESHSTEQPDYLRAVWESTCRDFPAWAMMVGPAEGRFLELMVFSAKAERVLEIGTFTGYSAIAMAAGLPPGGTVTTLEVDEHHAEVARANIAASPFADRIEVLAGPALESLEALEGPFDLVFIDADKTGYDAYLESVLPKLARRGVILADNTLQAGRVLPGHGDPAGRPGASAASANPTNVEAIVAFNDKVATDPRLVCAFTTIRDGVTIIRVADDG